jgi:hypothetical protein
MRDDSPAIDITSDRARTTGARLANTCDDPAGLFKSITSATERAGGNTGAPAATVDPSWASESLETEPTTCARPGWRAGVPCARRDAPAA